MAKVLTEQAPVLYQGGRGGFQQKAAVKKYNYRRAGRIEGDEIVPVSAIGLASEVLAILQDAGPTGVGGGDSGLDRDE